MAIVTCKSCGRWLYRPDEMSGTAWQCIGCGSTKIAFNADNVPERLAHLLEEEYKRVVWDMIYPGSNSAAREMTQAGATPAVRTEVPKQILARAQRGPRKAKVSALHLFGATLTVCLGFFFIYFATDAAGPFILLGGVLILGGMSWGAIYVLYTLTLQIIRTVADEKDDLKKPADFSRSPTRAWPKSEAIQTTPANSMIAEKRTTQATEIKKAAE
jgi:hypothetical protein